MNYDPHHARTERCPWCGGSVTGIPYDIGSGPELCCPHCQRCFGADGQALTPITDLVNPPQTVHGIPPSPERNPS